MEASKEERRAEEALYASSLTIPRRYVLLNRNDAFVLQSEGFLGCGVVAICDCVLCYGGFACLELKLMQKFF